jgi:hypothetical protein
VKYTRILAAGLVAFTLAACDGKDDDPTGVDDRATVRFMNATSDVAGLNFTVNGTAQTGAQNLVFGAQSTCVDLSTGSTAFGATAIGGAAFGSTFSQTLATGGEYTVLATGTATNPTYLFLNNQAAAPVVGRARLRIINAVPGVTASDIFVTAPNAALGTAAASNIGFNVGTTFLDVPAGQTQIRFTNTGTQTVSYTSAPFTVAAGSTQTIGIAPGTTAGTFRTFVIEPCD